MLEMQKDLSSSFKKRTEHGLMKRLIECLCCKVQSAAKLNHQINVLKVKLMFVAISLSQMFFLNLVLVVHCKLSYDIMVVYSYP